jgi:hypothetical protein
VGIAWWQCCKKNINDYGCGYYIVGEENQWSIWECDVGITGQQCYKM